MASTDCRPGERLNRPSWTSIVGSMTHGRYQIDQRRTLTSSLHVRQVLSEFGPAKQGWPTFSRSCSRYTVPAPRVSVPYVEFTQRSVRLDQVVAGLSSVEPKLQRLLAELVMMRLFDEFQEALSGIAVRLACGAT